VMENPLDPRRLFDQRDASHGSGASGTDKRIDVVHLLDEARLAAASVTSFQRLDGCGRLSLCQRLLPLPLTHAAV